MRVRVRAKEKVGERGGSGGGGRARARAREREGKREGREIVEKRDEHDRNKCVCVRAREMCMIYIETKRDIYIETERQKESRGY